MSKASTKNYDNAMNQYNALVTQYEGSKALKDKYEEGAEVASKNSKQVQQDKYNSYLSQGLSATQAAKMASKDASDNYTQEKNQLANELYNADKDVVNAQNQNLDYSKAKDDVSNQNKGRVLSTVGGVVSGVANAISDENLKDIQSESESNKEDSDFEFYMDLLR